MPHTSKDLIVYKYRNWSDQYHKDVLLKNELFFAPPASFNDPFDYTIPTNLYLLDTTEKILKYARKLGEPHRLKMDAATFNERQKKFIHDLHYNMDKVQERLEVLEAQANNSQYGILSLSEVWDSIIMWSHYADKHEGICIGFIAQFLKDEYKMSRGGPVTYTIDYPKVDPLEEDIIKQIWPKTMYKSKEWKYEQELRIVRGFEVEPSVEERKFRFPDHFVAEVIIGLSATEETRKEIVSICKEKSYPVYQAKKVPFEFRIERQLITD